MLLPFALESWYFSSLHALYMSLIGLIVVWLLSPCGIFKRFVPSSSPTTKQDRFKLEIREMSTNYVQIGLHVPKHRSGDELRKTMLTGLTVIAKKDPLIIRLLLLHTLEVLAEEEDISQVLKEFSV
ncbi:MAG: hypothetical protein AAFQ94_03465 [Bacteroidota bacterium]